MVFLWIISIPTISILYLNIDFDKKEYIEYIVVDRYIKYDNGSPEYNYNVVKIKDLSSSNINTINVSEETYYENCDIYFTKETSSSDRDIFLGYILLSIISLYCISFIVMVPIRLYIGTKKKIELSKKYWYLNQISDLFRDNGIHYGDIRGIINELNINWELNVNSDDSVDYLKRAYNLLYNKYKIVEAREKIINDLLKGD